MIYRIDKAKRKAGCNRCLKIIEVGETRGVEGYDFGGHPGNRYYCEICTTILLQDAIKEQQRLLEQITKKVTTK